MNIHSEKISLMEWIKGITDDQTIRQLKMIQKSSQQQEPHDFTPDQKSAIDKGLKSIELGETHSHESVLKSTKVKYAHLFKK